MDSICKYKDKLDEALTLAANMNIETKLEAVSYWNSAATHFQKIVNYRDPIQQQQQEQLNHKEEHSSTYTQLPSLENDIESKKISTKCDRLAELNETDSRDQTISVATSQHMSPLDSNIPIVVPAAQPATPQQQYDSDNILEGALFSSVDYFQVTNVIEDIKQLSSHDAIDSEISLTSAPNVIGASDSHTADYSSTNGRNPDTNTVISPLLALVAGNLKDADGGQRSGDVLLSGKSLDNILSSNFTPLTDAAATNCGQHQLEQRHCALQDELYSSVVGNHQQAQQDTVVFVPIFNDSPAAPSSSVFPDNADTLNTLFERLQPPAARQIPVGSLSGLDYDESRSSMTHIAKKAANRHDICNGQFDRGPEHDQGAISQSYFDELMSDGASFDGTATTFMTNNDDANLMIPFRTESYTHGVRPLQQIQVYDTPDGVNALADMHDSRMSHQQDLEDVAIRQQLEHRNEQLPIGSHQQQHMADNDCLSLLISPPSSATGFPTNRVISPSLTQLDKLATSRQSVGQSVWVKPADDQHTCQLCGKTGFSTKGNLKRHLKAHTGEKPYQCDFCKSKFTEKKSLKIHLRRHTGEKPYKCEICHKLFSQTGVLKSHMALHLEERKFNCSKCDKSFRQKSQLNLHLMRHDGIKKLACQTCQAKFLTKGDLERHFRIHTGERPYSCKICGKTFTRQQSLNEHLNRHTGKKPFECKWCDKKFSEMSACYKVRVYMTDK